MSTAATAVVLDDPDGTFVLREVELDDPPADEILVVRMRSISEGSIVA